MTIDLIEVSYADHQAQRDALENKATVALKRGDPLTAIACEMALNRLDREEAEFWQGMIFELDLSGREMLARRDAK